MLGPALVARQAGQRAVLDEMVGARLVVDVELGDHVDDLARTKRGAQPPAGHGELLGEGVEDHAALGHARKRGQRSALARVADVEVGLVAEHHKVVFKGELGEARELGRRGFGAHRVLQVVDDEQPGTRRDGGLEGFEIDDETVVVFEVAVGHGDAPVKLDLRLVDGIARVGVEHLVAGVHERQDELADHRLAAGLDGDVLHVIGKAVRGAHVGRHRGPQLRDARVRTVAGMTVRDRLEGRLDDVAGRRDVEVADMEGIDLVSFGGERGRLGRHRERGLSAQTIDALGDPWSGYATHRLLLTHLRLDELPGDTRAAFASSRSTVGVSFHKRQKTARSVLLRPVLKCRPWRLMRSSTFRDPSGRVPLA